MRTICRHEVHEIKVCVSLKATSDEGVNDALLLPLGDLLPWLWPEDSGLPSHCLGRKRGCRILDVGESLQWRRHENPVGTRFFQAKHAWVNVYLRTYPRRTPLSCGSGGGCHWTMMDWLVRPLATMFFGGALGASSLSINLKHTTREKYFDFTAFKERVICW